MGNWESHTEVIDSSGHSATESDNPESKLARIAAKARNKPQEQFTNLLHHLNRELIQRNLEKIPSKSAVGVDGITAEQARDNLDWMLPTILEQIHQNRYTPPPVRRVYIPKSDGRQRPIGVPSILDRAIQAAMTTILNQIYEQDFLNCSFGFRPGTGCHHALATIQEAAHRLGLNYALEVDIRDFFGSLSHKWLRKFLELRIGDERVLALIEAWLKAGVMEQGRWSETVVGTPQGGSISPLLANVYLHYVLDLWWEKKIKRRLRGKAHLVRYADDFVILFSRCEDADIVLQLLKTRLSRFDLLVAEEKTHITDLTLRERKGAKDRRRMTFLGFSIYAARTRSGRGRKLVYQTDGKRFSRAKGGLKARLIQNMHRPISEQAEALGWYLRGHYNYFGMPGNSKRLTRFWETAVKQWRRTLSKRSQRGKVWWKEMYDILQKHPLPRPRLRMLYTDIPQYARL